MSCQQSDAQACQLHKEAGVFKLHIAHVHGYLLDDKYA
jgi:hypothetical protein